MTRARDLLYRCAGRWAVRLMILFGFALPLAAQEPKAPQFELHTADGITHTGPIEQIRDDWSISLGGDHALEAKGADIITLRRSQLALPRQPQEEHVIFANGDRIPGQVLEISGERLRMQAQLGSGQEMTLPLTAVTVVWFSAPKTADGATTLARRLSGERRRRDVLQLRNGDSIQGTLSSLNDKQVQLQSAAGKDMRLDRDNLAVIALNTALARVPRPGAVFGKLILTNGARLSITAAHSEGLNLVAETVFGKSVRIPFDQIAALDRRQGRAVYLSDLKASRYEHTPFLGVRWPYVPDGSVAGFDLLLAGSTYDKGLGMHSESRLSYDLSAGYQWFEALVGLDERTGKQGSVAVDVLVDGKSQAAGNTSELTGKDKPRLIRISVAGAKELTLVVKFGSGGDVQDHVDWADARLLK